MNTILNEMFSMLHRLLQGISLEVAALLDVLSPRDQGYLFVPFLLPLILLFELGFVFLTDHKHL